MSDVTEEQRDEPPAATGPDAGVPDGGTVVEPGGSGMPGHPDAAR